MTSFEKKAIEALADLKASSLDAFQNKLIWNLYKISQEDPGHSFPAAHQRIICSLVLKFLPGETELNRMAKTQLSLIGEKE